MKNRILMTFFLLSGLTTFGQKECNSDIIGEWTYNNQVLWGVHSNVDSLKANSLINKFNENSTIVFNKDSTYTISYKTKNKVRTYLGYYSLNKKKCELILSRRKNGFRNIKYRDRNNWEIIYSDNEILIYTEDNNPKSIATHVLLK